MSTSTPLRAASVISATHHLHGRLGTGPTAEQVAKHVRAEEEDVLRVLRYLKGQRIFDDRRREGQRRWFPWDAVN